MPPVLVAALPFGQGVPLSRKVLFTVVALLVVAVLARRGWLKLLGPVLFYDLVRTGRRVRYILLRTLYVLFLGLLLLWVYFVWTVEFRSAGGIPVGRMSEFAQSFFYTFMSVQFLVA